MSVLDDDKPVARAQAPVGEELLLEIPQAKAWTPDDPHLYDVEIRLEQDRVRSYFGMRKFSVERDKHGVLRFFLNNWPFFFNGVLDQGYWPDGLMTAPGDEALVYDIARLKALILFFNRKL